MASEDDTADYEGTEFDNSEETPEATSDINPEVPVEDVVSNETSEPATDTLTEQ